MSDPLQRAALLQTAFTQAEGELRSKVFFRCEYVTAAPAGSEPPIIGTANWRLIRCLTWRAHATIQRPKTIQSP